LVVGLTGGIASGKSTVANILTQLGAHMIDADEISRKMLEPGMPAFEEIRENFGNVILRPDRTVDRKKLGQLVFSDRDSLRKLNAIMHPYIIRAEKKETETSLHRNPKTIVVINAAILIESGHYKDMDKIIVVDVPEEVQVERSKESGITEDETRARIKAQIPRKERLQYADFVIDNNQAIEETRAATEKVFSELNRLMDQDC